MVSPDARGSDTEVSPWRWASGSERQEALFITADELPQVGGPSVLSEAQRSCWPRPASIAGSSAAASSTTSRRRSAASLSIPPGVYFRMLLVGYFEGIDSQRGIAWRCADSLSLRQFLGMPLDEATPDHSTLTNTRKRLPPEVFDEVFQFVLRIAGREEAAVGQDGGRRQHDAGGQRGDEEHRPPRHGRGLEGSTSRG